GSLMIQYPEHCEEPAMEPHRPDSPAVPDIAIIPAQNLPGAAAVSPDPDSPEPPARVAVARPVHASRSLAALLLGLTSFLVVNLTSLADRRDPDVRDSKDWPEVQDGETGKPLYLAGTGSGCIVEPNWILTNNHVVTHAHRLRVTFLSGHTVIVGEDRIHTDPL